MHILVVEDEEPIREVIKKYLQLSGFSVDEAGSGEVAIAKFKNNYDLVILDLNLPRADGLEVCRAIRKKSKVPIIVVTARSEEMDELKGLEIGADDYIRKPFSPKVLIARVQTMLRRANQEAHTGSDIAVFPERMEVRRRGKSVSLTTTQFKIVYTLTQNPGKVFSRHELMEATHEPENGATPCDRTIDAHIKSIRKAIEDEPQRPRYIITVIGAGYKFAI